MLDRLLLRDGVQPDHALGVLTEIIRRSQDVGSQRDILDLRGAYLFWIEFAEPQLAAITLDPAARTMLQTSRYSQIWRLGLDGVSP